MIRQKNVAKKNAWVFAEMPLSRARRTFSPGQARELEGDDAPKSANLWLRSRLARPWAVHQRSHRCATGKIMDSRAFPPEAVMLTKACNGFGPRRRDKPGHDEALRGASWLGPSCRRWCRPT